MTQERSRRTNIHRFSLLRQLGSGAMGVVYEAFDPTVERRLALKVLRSFNENAELLVRFKREFRLVKAVQHPNVVSLGELFSEDDEWFFTMELVEGTDFLSWVRGGLNRGRSQRPAPLGETSLHGRARETGGAPFEDSRLREGLRQLVSALEVTHAAGIVHRDVKPSNVLVAQTGRVVVLDFGVAADVRSGPATASLSLVGTPAYMSPEQAVSGAASPATDMYSIGVMLFEALTGVRPIEGSTIDVMTRKQSSLPASPRDVFADVPEDLSRLAMDLLSVDPAQRPTATAVLERLGHRDASGVDRVPTTGRRGRIFVGRQDELATLDAAYAESRAGKPVTVVVRGESGIGKSVLVDHFVKNLETFSADAVVLRGRCRENEWIPFKAFDGIMDDLTRLLLRLPREAAAILPLRAEQLAQVFPVFKQVVGTRPRVKPAAEDPTTTRSRLFSSVRELFARLVERFPVVIAIDDLQWADADSLALLLELTRPPDAPAALLLITSRADTAGAQAPVLGAVRVVEMRRLSASDSVALAREIAGAPADDASGPTIDALAIAREAQGHPMFIAELVRYSASSRADASLLRLDDALAERLRALDERSSLVLDVAALAGRPVPLRFLERATGVPFDDVTRIVAALRSLHALRAAGTGGDMVEPYHDRIREVSLASIAPEAKAGLHRRIAVALEAGDGARDHEALSMHWRGAGDDERANDYAAEAAREASDALAFDHAARLYEAILASRLSPADEAAFAARLGEARMNGGHCAAAAAAFRRAAQKTSPIDALPLLQEVAEQELRAGLIEQGLQTMREVLTALRIAPPKSLWLALFSFLFWRLVLRVRGLEFRRRSLDEIQPRMLTTIDVCWSISFSLSAVDPIRGTDFQTRQLLLALRVGDPLRVARALALDIPYQAGPGATNWRRTEALIARCEAMAAALGDARTVGFARGTAGIAAYLSGKFPESLELMDRGIGQLAEVPGVWAEVMRIRRFAISALAMTGRFRELCERVEAFEKDAVDHGDLHSRIHLVVGHPHLVSLIRDRPDEGRAALREAMGQWTNPGFSLENLYEVYAEINADLYVGDPAAARRRVLDRAPALEASLLLHIPSAHIISVVGRARAWLALAKADATERALAAEADRIGRSIASNRERWTWPMGALLRAGAARVQGRDTDAEPLLRECAARFDAHGMAYLAAVSRRALGRLIGGDAGRELVGSAEAAMRAEGIVDVERFAGVWAPGL